MKTVAIVPARSGSKRLSNKNIKMLAGKPLVVWTLEACINSKYVDQVIFSTDSEDYWQLVSQYIQSDKLTLSLRTAEEAGDKVKIFDYIKSNFRTIFPFDTTHFLLALPTMPLREHTHINEAIELSLDKDLGVFSAVEYDAPISFAFYQSDDTHWEAAFESCPMNTGNTRSQDQKTAYHPNGAIYYLPLSSLENEHLMSFYQGATPYIMDRKQSVDIDTETDFRMAEILLNELS